MDFLRRLFRTPFEDNVERFYAVVDKYGYGEVPAREVYATFEGIASPVLGGFSIIKPGVFARPVNIDIVHVLKLQARKGGAYTVCWGACLTYLPQVRGGRLRWPRTLKSANLDLWEDPFEYFGSGNEGRGVSDRYFAQNGHGAQYLRETMTEMWSVINDPVQSWFRATEDLTSVLNKIEEQQKRKWRGPRHLPDPQIIRAFTLHRLARTGDARLAFDEYVAREGVPTTDADLLRAALDI